MNLCAKHAAGHSSDLPHLTILLFPVFPALSIFTIICLFLSPTPPPIFPTSLSPSVLQYALCRDVTLPPGPIYRVAGFPLSLPCVVSGFEGPRTQDFEWFLYREDAGGRQIGVVSTRDQGFPYAPFQPRVRSGEVRVERDAGDKARLVVQRLRPEDQGKYECYTPSTDTTFQGNYSASVAVKGKPRFLLGVSQAQMKGIVLLLRETEIGLLRFSGSVMVLTVRYARRNIL